MKAKTTDGELNPIKEAKGMHPHDYKAKSHIRKFVAGTQRNTTETPGPKHGPAVAAKIGKGSKGSHQANTKMAGY